ncbi:tripartite tricarboxylate transporter substrate binding protein [Ottowia sp. GY511]|uniref:Bug family tripartite tricarboxylate transporter substrate binding protein n=1 Tax=Ottowia flava TaxID=2675430 RepID=A0ABW4KRM2_9BURK|nr:tripartite tricarboxylate transporter substrate binding protein [Ottowia sp. GY511]TXK23544.1 tripartite tricarboxylate transporter substrate binding protein [Ottowia sp. GY511]
MKPMSIRRRQVLAGAASTLVAPWLTHATPALAASEKLGTRPVRIIVPFPGGGGGDSSTRVMAEPLAAYLNVPVIVDNRPGGDGVIAVQELLRAPADGHTIMFGTPSALLYTPQLTPKRPPYDPLKDLTPISHFSSLAYFIYVNDQVPVKTMAELVDYVHKNPGKLAYGTGDSTQLVSMAQLRSQANLDMIHVPYKGSSNAYVDFIGNRIQIMIGGFELVEQSKGKARPVATLLSKRSALLPEVPTLAESKLAPVTTRAWTALFAPGKTPMPIVEQLSAACAAVFSEAKLQEYFKARGSVLEASSPDAMRKILIEQMPVFAHAIKTYNLYKE